MHTAKPLTHDPIQLHTSQHHNNPVSVAFSEYVCALCSLLFYEQSLLRAVILLYDIYYVRVMYRSSHTLIDICDGKRKRVCSPLALGKPIYSKISRVVCEKAAIENNLEPSQHNCTAHRGVETEHTVYGNDFYMQALNIFTVLQVKI